jgi:hypothetical protein
MRLWSKVLHFLDTQGRAKPIEHNGGVIFGDKLQAKNVARRRSASLSIKHPKS